MTDAARSEPLAERLLPWLLLAPPALLAWPLPGALLERDPFPHAAGAGLVALASLPLALALLALRAGPSLRALAPLLALATWIAGATWLGAPADAFEARRALVQAGVWVVSFAGGLALDERGRRRLLVGLAVLSLAWTTGALARDLVAGEGHLAGVLGNSGTLSQAALPGAVAGAWLVASGGPAARVLGLAALLPFLLHAALAPVHAGGASLAFVLLLSALLARRALPGPRARVVLVACAAAMLVLAAALRFARSEPAGGAPDVAATPAAAPAADTTGGVAVRLGIWRAVLAVVGAHPLAGLGPGQFRAEFPPYREPREAVLSRHGVCSQADTEVEHAHCDLLEACAELGLVGGALFALFLALAARGALRSLRGADALRACAGAASLALLANGLVHAPLFANPAAAAPACALFGAVLGAPVSAGARSRRGTALFVAALGVANACLALPLVEHGRALVDYVRAAAALAALPEPTSGRPGAGAPDEEALRAAAADAREAIQRALAAAPDSAYARVLEARAAASDPARLARWADVLAVRPHASEALEALGLVRARSGEVEAARAAWERALDLTARSPRVLENLARLELVDGDPSRGEERIAELRAAGCLDPAWRATLGIELVLRGRFAPGARLFLERELEALVPEELFAEAGRGDGTPALPHRAEALKALAQLLWGRAHVAERDFDAAVRSYRQALVPTRLVLADGAPALRAELAAAECLAGRAEDARATLGAPLARELELVPGWARAALVEAGLVHAAGSPR